MRKLIFKSRLIQLILIILMTLFYSLIINSAIYGFRDSYNAVSIYKNTNIDFVVPNPSKDQCDDMESLEFIEKVVPYYYTKSEVIFNNIGINEDVILLDNFNYIEYTPYSLKRCVLKDDDINGKVLIDYSIYKKLHLKINDEIKITIGGVSFMIKIGGVYETNNFFKDGAICIALNESMKKEIEDAGNKLSYGSAYISSNNLNECQNYLMNNYKPMGLFRDRDSFESDESYELFVKGFNETNYSNEIFVLSKSYEEYSFKATGLSKTAYVKIILSCVVFFIIILVLEMLFINNKNLNNRISALLKKGEKKQLIIENLSKTYIIQIVISLLLYILISILFYICSKEYMKMNTWIIWALVGLLYVLIIQLLLSIIVTKKNKRTWS